MATGSVLAAVSTADLVLLGARVIQGFALAMLISAFMLSVVRARPGRGVALMIINVGAGLGTVCGLIASGVLTSTFSWNAVFWAVAILSVVIVAVALVTPRRRGLATHPANTLDPAIVDQNHAPLRGLLAPIGLNLIIQGAYGVFQVAFPLYAAWRFDAGGSEIGTLLLVTTGTHIACSVLTGRLIAQHGAAIVIPFGWRSARSAWPGCCSCRCRSGWSRGWLPTPVAWSLATSRRRTCCSAWPDGDHGPSRWPGSRPTSPRSLDRSSSASSSTWLASGLRSRSWPDCSHSASPSPSGS